VQSSIVPSSKMKVNVTPVATDKSYCSIRV